MTDIGIGIFSPKYRNIGHRSFYPNRRNSTNNYYYYHYHYYYYNYLMAFFQDNLGKLAPER